jgi:hypothetical protein
MPFHNQSDWRLTTERPCVSFTYMIAFLSVAVTMATPMKIAAAEPGTTFKAVIQPTNPGIPRGALYGDFTLNGPLEETLVPLPDNVGEVVTDSTRQLLFGMGGHELYQLDLLNRKATEIAVNGVPDISWAMGLAYDTRRNRVLLATLGGEGYIYSYDHRGQTWSILCSLNNVDVTAIAYLKSCDHIFAIGYGPADSREEGAFLYEYDAVSGRLIQRRSIELPIDGDFIDRGLQLIPVDDSLVFIQVPTSAKNATPRFHVIDPKSGTVQGIEE